MAVVFKSKEKTKKVQAAKPKSTKTEQKVSPKVAQAREQADIIILNQKAVEAAKDPAKNIKTARAVLLDLVGDDYSPTEEIIVEGTKGKVKFSACAVERKVIELKKLHKKLGDDLFYELAKVSATDIDKYLTPAEGADFIDKNNGSRTLSVLPN